MTRNSHDQPSLILVQKLLLYIVLQSLHSQALGTDIPLTTGLKQKIKPYLLYLLVAGLNCPALQTNK